MKKNNKGMTLVECIIAMAVFAVATTGFTMAATSCIRAQIKSHARNRIANEQTTNLEHFSNYSKVIGPTLLNVKEMPEKYGVSFDFGTIKVVNKDVYGYTALADPEDKTYQLSFISPIERVTVLPGEWWITIYNADPTDKSFDIYAQPGFIFFNNEKEDAGTESLDRIYPANGGMRKIGIRNISGDNSSALVISDNSTKSQTINLVDYATEKNTDNTAGYVSIYYENGEFVNKETYESNHAGE
ncbi:prepilin-type N-terminal cleavage/methylation domain-containing protein [Ruminococcus albus]|uniref:type IV pilus modification PilV family protein n=1 Tax=Ruminococcus albus TaxID=1264 RepID=UPI001D15718C|nr:prepilin-type N-terminal cleavage/methylation domain-containing protein [Ruminococcus albus]MCC3349829.1 prepilin-type N-terminal cleavage/methylation domain-containing protein [Ruminococcus albus 8]